MLASLNRGGTEMLELDVCRNAHANHLDLLFVTTGGGDLEDDFRASGAEFMRMRRVLPFDPVLVGNLRRLIRREKIGVVHAHQPVDALHLWAATRGLALKRILTLHGWCTGWKNRMALKFLLPRMDARVFVTDDMRQAWDSEHGPRARRECLTVYNGVDFNRLEIDAAQNDFRKKMGWGSDVRLAGMIANFYADQRKDPMTVCRALPSLFQRVPGAQFVFVGARAERAPRIHDECVNFCREHGISDRVHFLGKRTDVASILAALDVFVLSSRRDTFGIAAVEAMGLGVPAVLSDIGALREISGDGKSAVLFRTGDERDLAEKLTSLLLHREERLVIAASGKEWARSRFSIERHIAGLIALYDRLGAANACAS